MYLNGMGLRGIGHEHSSPAKLMRWIRSCWAWCGCAASDEIQKLLVLDELPNVCGQKATTKSALDCPRIAAFGHHEAGCGRPGAETFKRLWWIVKCLEPAFGMEARWLYGLSVFVKTISGRPKLICRISENDLRHYLARCTARHFDFKSIEIFGVFSALLLSERWHRTYSPPNHCTA